jgi:hypothetical protein
MNNAELKFPDASCSSRKNVSFFCGVMAVAAAGFVFFAAIFPLYRYALNPDGVSYISLAYQYAQGHWSDAVNAYWGPLLTWLIAGCVFFGLDAVFAAKILQCVIGIALSVSVYIALRKKDVTDAMAIIAAVSFLPVATSMTMLLVNPDALLALLVFWYVFLSPRLLEGGAFRAHCVAGVLGFLMYAAKAYGAMFFVASYAALCAVAWVRKQQVATVKGFAAGLFVFLVLSVPWVTALSVKAGRFTVATTPKFNRTYYGPYANNFYGPKVFLDERHLSSWDDLTYLDQPEWLNFSDARTVQHQAKTIFLGMRETVVVLFGFSPLVVVLFGSIFFAAYRRHWRSECGVYLGLAVLYCVPYMAVSVKDRFLWPVCLMMYVYLTYAAFHLLRRNRGVAVAAVLVVALSFAPVFTLSRYAYAGDDVAALAASIDKHAGPIRLFASDSGWANSLALAAMTRGTYVGMLPVGSEELRALVAAGRLDVYVRWKKASPSCETVGMIPSSDAANYCVKADRRP